MRRIDYRMSVLELLVKLALNALAVVTAFMTTEYFAPGTASVPMFVGFYVGMATAHITYLGPIKKKIKPCQ